MLKIASALPSLPPPKPHPFAFFSYPHPSRKLSQTVMRRRAEPLRCFRTYKPPLLSIGSHLSISPLPHHCPSIFTRLLIQPALFSLMAKGNISFLGNCLAPSQGYQRRRIKECGLDGEWNQSRIAIMLKLIYNTSACSTRESANQTWATWPRDRQE